MICVVSRLLVIVMAAAWLSSAAFAAERIAPESPKPWRVSPPVFPEGKERANVSGLVCAPNAPDFCLIVTDEGHEAAFARLTEGRLTPGSPFSLPIASEEFDAEGAAADGNFFYIVGSHSVKRKTCEDHLANRTVLRFRADSAKRLPGPIEPRHELWNIIERLPEFAGHAGPQACLGDDPPKDAKHLKGKQGVNIEGVAAKDGRLYFGFRGPAINGEALIVGVDAKALFEGGDAAPSVGRIRVGKKRAIRDLTFAGDALLALVGPDDDEQASSYSIFRIEQPRQGVAQASELAILDLDGAPRDKKNYLIKPEAVTALDATPERFRLLVLSDGGEDGAPLVFDIPRKP
ncbi:DUF3616 domain-containing protein [Methylocystis sp. SC2]|uniref:DUF3616 domain-containing protein n=1 Tax=Methylocystis sp. (strain SC2) TaxID=187303 RepID=UPI0002EA3B4F|nr:DUF3616 domain-containing protein [Methylocystis sp. SC2]